jgi:flagellar biosynthesis protein FlhG
MSLGIDRTKLWSVGGGKGGIGKSIVTLGLGVSLARMGKKVILIDCDLGGANLHTLLGIRYPQITLEHFLTRKVSRLEDTVIETPFEGISLICGADDILGAANPTYSQKIRLLRQMEELPAQYVLLDLGAGTAFNLLDFFNYSAGKVALFTSQTTSLQNAYGFIKSALYRKLSRDFVKDEQVVNLLYEVGSTGSREGIQSIGELLMHLAEVAPEKQALMSASLQDYQLYLINNMVRSNADLKSAEIIRSVCQDFLGIRPEILGHVPYDPQVEAAVSKTIPFPLHAKKGKAAAALAEIAAYLLKEARLARGRGERLVELGLRAENLLARPCTSES